MTMAATSQRLCRRERSSMAVWRGAQILDAITEQPAAKETKKWFTLPSGDTEDAKVATTSKSVVREEVRGGTWPKWVTELAQGGKAPLPELEDLPMGYRNMFIDLIAELAEFDTQLNRLKDVSAPPPSSPQLIPYLPLHVHFCFRHHCPAATCTAVSGRLTLRHASLMIARNRNARSRRYTQPHSSPPCPASRSAVAE